MTRLMIRWGPSHGSVLGTIGLQRRKGKLNHVFIITINSVSFLKVPSFQSKCSFLTCTKFMLLYNIYIRKQAGKTKS